MITRLLTWALLLGSSAAAMAQTLTQGNFTGVLVPQSVAYSATGSNTKLPVVYMATVSGLAPNTTYRYYNQLAQRADLGTTAAGAGTILFHGDNGFTFSSLGNTATSTAAVKSYDSLVTNSIGEYTGWFFNYTSTNARFRANNYLFPTIVLDSAGSGVIKRFALNDSIRTLIFSTDGVDTAGTLFYGESYAGSEKIVALYGNTVSQGRPLAITLTERLDTQVTSGMPAAYLANVAGKEGFWGAIVNNETPAGIRVMESYDPKDTSIIILHRHTDGDGVWPVSGNTVNPRGGTSSPVKMELKDASLGDLHPGFSQSSLMVLETDDSTALIRVNYPNLNHIVTQGYSIELAGGTGVEGTDFFFTALNPAVTAFTTSPDFLTFKIDLIDNALSDGNRTIQLALRNNSNPAVIGADSLLTITILDDESTSFLKMKSLLATWAETAGTAPIEVNISNPSATDSTEVWVVLKSISNPARLSFTDTLIKFPAGSTDSIRVFASLNDDAIYNGNDTAWFVLRSPTTGALIATDSLLMAVITDNETQPQIRFSRKTASIGETGGSLNLGISLSGVSSRSVSARVSLKSGTAVRNTDYLFNDTTITFDPLTTDSVVLSIPIVDNAVYTGNKNFALALRSISGATRGADSVATVTIVEDEIQLGPELNFSVSTQDGYERDGMVAIDVTISGSNSSATTVQVAIVGGTATAADYTYSTATLNFPANSTTPQRINLTLVDDTLREGNETIILALQNPTNSATIGTIARDTIVLREDNDNPNISFLSAQFYLLERRNIFIPPLQTDTVEIPVLLQQAIPGLATSVDVSLDTGGNAIAGADFSFSPKTLTWAAGESGVKEFTLFIPDNNDTNVTRNFFLKLGNATNNGIFYQFGRLEVIILDDEVGTGIYKTPAVDVVVYPNPGRDWINVKTTRNIERYTLTDVQGRVVEQAAAGTPELRLNVSGLAEGIYYLQAETAEGTATVKVLVR